MLPEVLICIRRHKTNTSLHPSTRKGKIIKLQLLINYQKIWQIQIFWTNS